MNQMRQTKKAYEGLYNKYIKRGLDIIITGNSIWRNSKVYGLVGKWRS